MIPVVSPLLLELSMAFILFVSEYLQDNLKKRHLISTMYPSVISTNVPSVFVASSLMVCKLNVEPKSDCLVLHIMGARGK